MTSKWKDVKAKGRAVDPRTDAERAAGKQAARERREAYVRGHQVATTTERGGVIK